MYEYAKSKESIVSILKSPTKIVEKTTIPASESEFTYENGAVTFTLPYLEYWDMIVIE